MNGYAGARHPDVFFSVLCWFPFTALVAKTPAWPPGTLGPLGNPVSFTPLGFSSQRQCTKYCLMSAFRWLR